MLELNKSKMTKKELICFSIVVILAIFLVRYAIYTIFPSNQYDSWTEQDFMNQHCSYISQVSEYCTTGDYDLAVEYMEKPEVLEMYTYAEKNHIYPEMIQSYLFVYNSVSGMDEMLRNAVRFYVYKDKYVVFDLDTMRVFLEMANEWTIAEDVNKMYATLRSGFLEFNSNKGILYKYKLKMEQE